MIVMLAGMMPALGITINAATPTTNEGMTFTADELFKIPYKLDVSKPEADVAITFEAEIYLDPAKYNGTSSSNRGGVILGSYDLDPGNAELNFEIYHSGCVRFYSDSMGINQLYFDDDGGASCGTNEKYNIFDNTNEDGFVKIAVVANLTDMNATLYFNGIEQVTYSIAKKTTVNGFNTAKELCIGGDNRTNNGSNFKGEIKNVTLYSDVRTDAEILASGTATTYSVDSTDPNLWCAYDLTDDEAPLNDLSVNGRNAGGVADYGSNGGMKFSSGNLHQISNGKLNITGPAGYDEAITFEAEIFIPYDKKATRPGIIVGTYTDDEAVGKTGTDMNFEIQTNGVMRFYSAHMDNILFSDYNIFDDMGGETEAKFAKVAYVINITAKTAKLYVNGELKSTKALSGSATGEFKLPQYFYLGGDLRINNSQYFKGNIKNVTLYSDARTEAELLASGTATTYSVDNTDENLLFAYDLSSGSKANMKDLSKNGYNVEFVPKVGKTFTADDAYQMSKPLPYAPKTFEATIYMPDMELNGNFRGGDIVSTYNSSGNQISFEINEYGNPKIYYTGSDGADHGFTCTSVDVRTYNDWVHVTIVLDDTNADAPVLRYYINGKLVLSQATQGNRTVVPYNETLLSELSRAMYIGTDTRKSEKVCFKGYIKDITLYGDVRTAAEVKSDYENGAGTYGDNLLVAYDFTKAADFKDLSGNGYDIKRQDGEGLSFTKDTLYRTEGKLSAVPYSFETWVYLPKTQSTRAGVIFGNYDGGGRESDLGLEIYSNGNPRLFYNGLPSNTATVFTEVDIRSDNWVHLAIVKDEANDEIHCYLNGELAQTITGANDFKSGVAKNVEGFGLGGDMRNYATAPSKFNERYFTGALRDFAIFSDVRTADEIKADYEQGINTSDAGLISYYDLGNVADGATKITDIKGKNNVTTDWNLVSGIDKTDYEYSFAFIGDTQKIVQTDAKNALDDTKTDTDYAKQIYQWIADNKDTENIKYVFGLGDITETGAKVNNPDAAALAKKEWDVAYNAMAPLRDANVNYALIAGNHENPSTFTTHFGNDNFMTDKITGYYSNGADKLGNYYVNFEVGETKYMFIALQFGAVDEILDWASGIVEANPDRKVIMATHAYMFRDGTTLDKGDVVPPDSTGNKAANNGDEMWEKFVSQHGNIVLVVSGHDPYENISWRQDIGVNGNTVSQFLIDPQGMSPTTTGMVALFHFSADGSQVAVEYVSTHRTATLGSNVYYRNQNQFEFDLYEGAKENVYDVEGDAENYTAYYTNGKVASFTADNTLATVNGYIVSLEGNIGVKSFMNIPAFSNTDKLYAKFIVDGEEYVQYFKDAVNDANYGYGFKGLVSAAQMTSEIKIELCYDGIVLLTATTSVAEYAKVILDSTDNEEYIEAQSLVKAMLNYGAAAQAQFGQNLDKPANSIVTDVTVGDNKDAINASASSNVSGSITGLTYKSTTLGLESETALYHFFTVTDTDVAKYTVVGADEVKIIDNVLRVKIAGIGAANLSTEYAVSVTYNGETVTVTANAMAYAKAVVNSDATSAELKTLMSALYEYNAATVAYNG